MTTGPRSVARDGLTVRHDVDHSVTVSCDGTPLLTYVYVPDDVRLESPRPYLHPIRTRGGDPISLFRPHDHVWHKGIAWSLPYVGPHNFWGGPTYVHGEGYVQLDNNGSMDHETLTDLSIRDERVCLAHTLHWHSQPREGSQVGDTVVEEHRAVTVTVPSADAWVLTFSSTMTNVSESPLDLGSPTTRGRENAGYGGLFWRGPRSFTGGTLLLPGRAGGEELRGTRSEWAGFTGRQDGTDRDSTIVVVDDSSNPVHPPRWFLRTEQFACLCPAPFFSTELAFSPGATLGFRYAVVIADGGADPAQAEKLASLGRDALRLTETPEVAP